jgi:8-oxo-dGTP pyrophosphatase MutT (NUDIX family)
MSVENSAMTVISWPALRAAQAHDRTRRLPLLVDGVEVGSVARAHLDALAPFVDALAVANDAVRLLQPMALAHINDALRRAGLIAGWRDETYALVDPGTLRRLGTLERAAARFWGTLTFGAHCNGYVADASGRPTHLWIARRALDKSTDPGKLDNLIGGGVPHGQTPWQTLLREGWEEAGLQPAQVQAARAGRMVRLCRDIPEGLQHEWLYVYDLALPADVQPRNQDGEVAELQRLSVDDALALAARDEMTVDASLVTLDFALRHDLLRLADDAATDDVIVAARPWLQG